MKINTKEKKKGGFSMPVMRFGVMGLFALMMLMYCSGCDSFVEVDLPDSQLTSPVVFEDRNTATAALTEVYSKMRDNGMLSGTKPGLSYTLGLYADELDYYAPSGQDGFLYHSNGLLPTSSAMGSLWNTSYSQIYGANAVIYGVDNSLSLAQADRDQLKGEALFIRALLHFHLANLFGSIPYITSTDYVANSKVSKITVEQVYEKAKVDLENAIALLPEEYLSTDRTRANRYAAHSLLARVCLYAGDWAEAANNASAVLNQTQMYTLDTSLSDTFLIQSAATILQFSAQVPNVNTKEAQTFTFTGNPSDNALSPSTVASFETGDLRRNLWVKEIDVDGATYYHASKYTLYEGSQTEFSKVLRLSEIYLIRAEARARQGELSNARDDLNAVRSQAGLPDFPAVAQDELLGAIMRERRSELFTEFGHRFFDLKRTEMLDVVLDPVKAGWDQKDRLYPLPLQELQLNQNLQPQNIGY